MTKIAVPIIAVLGALLFFMAITDGCSAPQRLKRVDVIRESQSVDAYLTERALSYPFREDWYDTVRMFGALDTIRTKQFVATAFRFHDDDSASDFLISELNFKKSILLHDLNLLKITADTVQ